MAYCKNVYKNYTPAPKVYWNVSFADYDWSVLKAAQQVLDGADAVPPADPARQGYEFTGWEPSYTKIKSNLTCVAQYRYIKDQEPVPVVPGQPSQDDDINVYSRYDIPLRPGQIMARVSKNVSNWVFAGMDENGLTGQVAAV